MNNKSASVRAVVGAVIALFANMGINSVFTIYLYSFMAEWPDAPVANIALAATLGCAMAFVCSTFLVGPVLKKLSPRVIFLICAALGAIYCLLYSYATGLWMLVVAGLFGGVILAFGVHAMGVAAITPYFAAFGKKVGTIIGVVLAAAALGAAAFSFIPTILMNYMDWRKSFLVIAVIVVICNIVAFFIIPKQPKAEAGAGAAAAQAPEAEGLTLIQAVKTPSFWLTFVGILFMTIMYQGLCTYMPTFLKVCGMEEGQANSMQGIMQLVGIVFIFIAGAMLSKIGVRGLIVFAAVPLAAGCLIYALIFPSAVSFILAVVCSVLCVTGGVISNICPAITPALFGNKSINQINPIYSGGAFWGGAALASQIIGRVITDAADPASYSKGFIVATVIGIVGMVALFVALAFSPAKKMPVKAAPEASAEPEVNI